MHKHQLTQALKIWVLRGEKIGTELPAEIGQFESDAHQVLYIMIIYTSIGMGRRTRSRHKSFRNKYKIICPADEGLCQTIPS